MARFSVFLLACALATSSALAQPQRPLTAKRAFALGLAMPERARAEPIVGRLIVKLRDPSPAELVRPLGAARLVALSKSAQFGLKPVRAMSGAASVVALDAPLRLAAAREVAARLARDPQVEYAVPDVQLRKAAFPNETRFNEWQWNLFAPTTTYMGALNGGGNKQAVATGGANLPAAWDLTTGAAAVVVAVIDTGIVNHNDLNGINGGDVYTPAGRMLAGYDFISSDVGAQSAVPDNFVANDGNGRDADPSDPGDWVTAGEKSQYSSFCDDGQQGTSNSSWHGSHTAGIIAATANNAVGIAGIGWQVRILPLRALGKCGGALSDVADAIRWAAGLPVTGITGNPTPARVINLSLGGEGDCSAPLQAAVTAAIGAGSVVVAATGNEALPTLGQPANCTGAIAVTAHTINGENADYANVGAATTISAPGGGPPFILGAGGDTDDSTWNGFYVWSTILFGATNPTSTDAQNRSGSAYAGFSGTSAATPHVAGVAALIKSLVPTATPTQVRNLLVDNARPFPPGSACASGGTLFGQCGAGLLDAGRALQAAAAMAAPVILSGPSSVAVTAGQTATFSVTATGATPLTFQWAKNGAPIDGATSSTYTTPVLAVTDSGGMYAVIVTNSVGSATSAAATLIVTQPSGTGTGGTTTPPAVGSPAAPPTGGGGGSLPATHLLLLAAIVAAARFQRKPH